MPWIYFRAEWHLTVTVSQLMNSKLSKVVNNHKRRIHNRIVSETRWTRANVNVESGPAVAAAVLGPALCSAPALLQAETGASPGLYSLQLGLHTHIHPSRKSLFLRLNYGQPHPHTLWPQLPQPLLYMRPLQKHTPCHMITKWLLWLDQPAGVCLVFPGVHNLL